MEPVRLVIWDLDETFWRGTFSEGGIEFIERHNELVRELARRGIMSTIVSKNDYHAIRSVLQEEGSLGLFYFPRVSPGNRKGRALPH